MSKLLRFKHIGDFKHNDTTCETIVLGEIMGNVDVIGDYQIDEDELLEIVKHVGKYVLPNFTRNDLLKTIQKLEKQGRLIEAE